MIYPKPYSIYLRGIIGICMVVAQNPRSPNGSSGKTAHILNPKTLNLKAHILFLKDSWDP